MVSCAQCSLDTQPGEHLCCHRCWRRYHWECFLVEGFPNRLDEQALGARRVDCRRPDFVCEVCHFRDHFGRVPVEERDWYVCYLDRAVTIDEFHMDAGGMGNTYSLRQVARWGQAFGVPTMIAGTLGELHTMPADHRQLSWFLVDKAASFSTLKRMRSSLWNYYRRMPGLPEQLIPTSSFRFTHRMNGLQQRLGSESRQDRVFHTRLLNDLVVLYESDYRRAEGERKVELAMGNFALHLYFTSGMRPNEAFEERVVRFAGSFVVGSAARRMDVRPHFRVRAKTQTKTERMHTVQVLCSYATLPPCVLMPGKWARVLLQELTRVGRGPATAAEQAYLFATPEGAKWTMNWWWTAHVVPRLEQLQQEGLGGLPADADLALYGSNSPRRTWNSMAASHPNPVSVDLRERQGRWRVGEKRKVKERQPMTSLYADPDLYELLLATYWLSHVRTPL